MSKEAIEKRLIEVEAAITQSMAHHHILLGRREELREMLKQAFEDEINKKEGGDDAS